MSDELDRLADIEHGILEKQIQRARLSSNAQLVINGFCYYCDESCGQQPFCDEDCSKDWHDEQAAKVRRVGVSKSGWHGDQV
ncbi:hypothetical protein [Pantoea sp. CCBC3-3-1]|uniref:hypothetical protein n=1 Tax=Pantoea sp. CCBC3-3-1 TaxID=2490851 RepID=UPI0011BD4896|nr:hypothetical protein [Pantoea sp. CCBC3-3-1]